MTRATDHAYSEIRSLILSGDAPPGSALKEEQLAEICGVSRTPVRDALRRLEAELYVVRSESQRTFVADWSRADVEEMFALRAMLEAHAARRAAERMTGDMLYEMRACNAAIERAVGLAQPDVHQFLDRNRDFHAMIIATADSPRLAATLSTLVEQPIVRRTALHYRRDQLAQSANEHRELLQAFVAGDPEWAHAVMTSHIRRAFHAFSNTQRDGDREEI
ncbi:GntR family transcriptional regulator [Sphingomonas sp.]|uniref:GntR family transcriptional regulator n=1 Tax=Sphingomonas sp. TaxID=28214 RepID=UPI00286CFD6F|nr:GntR family transcriptional regulator [Sphingomonas sp.]